MPNLRVLSGLLFGVIGMLLWTGCGSGTGTSSGGVAPTVTITASPTIVAKGSSTTLTVVATNATSVVISDNLDSTTYSLSTTGGTQSVSPTATVTYTATASGSGGTATATAAVTVSTGDKTQVKHVLFMMQENRSFDSYFGMLNPYRQANTTNGQAWNVGDDGHPYNVDGIDDKLSTIYNVDDSGNKYYLFHTISTCLDDMSSAWVESYGSVNRYDFSTTRSILDDGFVHVAYWFALSGSGSGTFTGDTLGERAMAYYRDTSTTGNPELNYYYYMASQFALSDRWFSPVSSKTKPNRIATMAGGTTQGLVRDPGADDDDLGQLNMTTIFEKLSDSNVSWKIYYTGTAGMCNESPDNDTCNSSGSTVSAALAYYPTTTFEYFPFSNQYLYVNSGGAACTGTTTGSQAAVGDPNNAFCIDTSHVAPISQLFTDMTNGTLPAFAYIEPGYGMNDEHPGSGQSILIGQAQVANILNTFMSSPSWSNSIFFLARDISGGPYDHVPPAAGSSNLNTNIPNMGYLSTGTIPDISTIAVNADNYFPCAPPSGVVATEHCDLQANYPGMVATDAPAVEGFKAQLGFRVPNIVVSPFTRKHYVSHIPMDHTAVLRFVEDLFAPNTGYLTNRDAVQPDLLDFFDFVGIPWATPPTGMPTPPGTDVAQKTCTPAQMQ